MEIKSACMFQLLVVRPPPGASSPCLEVHPALRLCTFGEHDNGWSIVNQVFRRVSGLFNSIAKLSARCIRSLPNDTEDPHVAEDRALDVPCETQ